MKTYPFTEEYNKKSDNYKVWVMGEEIGVYACDVSAYPFNRVWGGVQRDKSQTEPASFVMLGNNGVTSLEIESTSDFKNVVVRPLSKNPKVEILGKRVKVEFDKCGQYSVEFDGMHNPLLVFINPENDFGIEKDNENVMYFGKGVHIVDERIQLEDNQTVFIDEGAVLYGSINATCKKNIKVVGYGILDNSRMRRANEINGCAILDPNAGEMTGNPIFFDRCENVLIDGVTFVDSSGWNIYLDGCENIVVDNIKLIGQWRYNADGCDFCNCTNGIIKNSFLRTFDDCVTVKGFKLNNNLPIENIVAENCVMWCDWGKAFEVGAETCAPYIKNVVFRDCDIIHGSIIMLDIQHGDRAEIDGIHFENIRMEYTGEELCPEIQETEEQKYSMHDNVIVPAPFMLTSGVSMWSIDNYCGNMKNIYFKDISIVAYDGMTFGECMIKPDISTSKVEGVYFENITVNGQKCDAAYVGLKVYEGVNGVFFDGVRID